MLRTRCEYDYAQGDTSKISFCKFPYINLREIIQENQSLINKLLPEIIQSFLSQDWKKVSVRILCKITLDEYIFSLPLKNFGFAGETTVVAPGINSKIDEIRSAFGLLNLKQADKAIEQRKHIVDLYRDGLKDVAGVRFLNDIEGVRYNYAYFPIFINEKDYGMSRDDLYELLKTHNILGRRYFYPLISTFTTYRGLESATVENLPVATRLADEVICLPIYAGLADDDVQRVVECVRRK